MDDFDGTRYALPWGFDKNDFDCYANIKAPYSRGRKHTSIKDYHFENHKKNAHQNLADGDCGRSPKRFSGRLRNRSALVCFLFFCRTCACLGEACGAPQNERSEFWGLASEPTCIKTSTRPVVTLNSESYFCGWG